MRKILLLYVILFLGILLPSCTKESGGLEGEGSNNVISVTFTLKPDTGVETKSGRDLVSQENLQEVSDMRLYLFRELQANTGEYQRVTLMEGMEPGGYYKVDWVKGTPSKAHTLKLNLEAGKYKFLAVGLDAAGVSYEFEGEKLSDVLLRLKTAPASEVFSGLTNELTIGANGQGAGVEAGAEVFESFYVSVTLKRMVAGVMMHVKNIPALLNVHDQPQVKKIALLLSENQNSKLYLTKEAAGMHLEPNQKIIGTKTLFEVPIPEGAVVENGVYKWSAMGGYAPNCIGGGAFVIPIAQPASGATLILELRAEDGAAIKSWRIQNRLAEKLYPLEANHLYSVGTKIKADRPTEPGTGSGPFDNPVDLSKDQDILLIIDASWEAFHDMTIN